ncbi:nucleotidyltransferase family protein [Pseudanabaena minima]|uniref:nucleotidyltransferase family protein n=1 Tax=Pseudanabaena minima TaxID=890415 RepID=UPI003DA8E16D
MATHQLSIEIPNDKIAEFCKKYHVRKLSLFGSVLRDDFSPESDVDFLVEFEKGKTQGFGIVRMERELSAMISRTADLRTPNELSKYFRQNVLSGALTIYVHD